MDFEINDPVIHVKNNLKGRVVDCSKKYGWFTVRWENGSKYEYNNLDTRNKQVVFLDLDRQKSDTERANRTRNRRPPGPFEQFKPSPY
jgi:hypothetical protein